MDAVAILIWTAAILYEISSAGAGISNSGPENHPNFRLLSVERCGSELSDKFIYGEAANLGQYPWIAAIEYQTGSDLQIKCGGTLINDRYIVTAAHCVIEKENSTLVAVRLAEHNLQTDPDCVSAESGQICADSVQTYKPAEIIVHPQYVFNSTTQHNDIALIRLDRKVPFTDFVVPICLPNGKALTKKYDGSKTAVAGWGRTKNGTNSNVKMWAHLRVIPTAECQSRYQRQVTLSENQMCAGGVDGKETCSNDSGGPLMVIDSVVNRIGGQWVLAGILSKDPVICGLQGIPGVYTRVGPYVNWILDHLKP